MNKYIVLVMAALAVGLAFVMLRKRATPEVHTDVLVVGTNPNFPPFEFSKDGVLEGFEIELVKELGKKLNKKITFKDLAFDALLLEMKMGGIQMIASAMTPTAERAKHVLFDKPYLQEDPLVVITLANNPGIRSLTELKDKEVVVNDGYTAESYMASQPGIHLKRLQAPAEAFLALSSGRAFAYVSARSAVQPFFDQYGTRKFNLFVIPGAYDSYALAVSKKYPELLKQVRNAMQQLEKDGTLTKLKQKWHLQW